MVPQTYRILYSQTTNGQRQELTKEFNAADYDGAITLYIDFKYKCQAWCSAMGNPQALSYSFDRMVRVNQREVTEIVHQECIN